MKKRLTWQLLIALLLISNFTFSQIISQYVETNSGSTPKGIEIWNNTSGTLDFAANNLVIKKGNNGGAPAPDFTLSSTTLAAGDVIVIGTSDMETVATGNGAIFHVEGFQFNGDDALEVWYGATKTDVFGMPLSDPGTHWVGNGVSTKNQNIELLSGITAGSLTGWTDPSTRFATVSTTPSTLPAGIAGFGIAPVAASAIPAPVFTPVAGTYYEAQSVTMDLPLGKDEANYKIYYTTDGTTEPDNTSTLYEGPIDISTTTTLKAVTYEDAAEKDDPYSSVTTGTYTIIDPIEVSTIADLRAAFNADMDADPIYELTNEAIITFIRTDNRNQKFIEDATGAILIDDPSGVITAVLNIGDGITGLIGTLSEYRGMLQIKPSIDPGAASTTGNPVIPTEVGLADFMADFENYESQLIQFTEVAFNDIGGVFVKYDYYGVTNLLGDDAFVSASFKETEVDYIGAAIPAGMQNVVGIAFQFNAGIGLAPRALADMTATGTEEVPLSSTGIMIAGLLIGLVIVIRRGRLF